MLAPTDYYFLHQELCLFAYRPVKKVHSVPLKKHTYRRNGGGDEVLKYMEMVLKRS